jgi:hypothetical protein
MHGVEALCGEQERSEFGSVQAPGLRGVDLGAAHVLSGVGVYPPVDVCEAVEPADGGQAPVDGGGGKSALFEGADVEFDLGSRGGEDVEARFARPQEEGSKVAAVGLERAVAVASQEGGGRQFGLVEREIVKVIEVR